MSRIITLKWSGLWEHTIWVACNPFSATWTLKIFSNAYLYPIKRKASSLTSKTFGLSSYIFCAIITTELSSSDLMTWELFYEFSLDIMTSSMMKVVPSLTLDSTCIAPPIFSTIILQMESPNPLPYGFYFRLAAWLLKSMNKFGSSLSGMPHP